MFFPIYNSCEFTQLCAFFILGVNINEKKSIFYMGTQMCPWLAKSLASNPGLPRYFFMMGMHCHATRHLFSARPGNETIGNETTGNETI